MRTRIITIITLLLSTPMIIAQKSMDEIDRESFAAKLSPIEVKGIQMTEAGNIPLVRDTPAKISLDGTWQLAEGGSEKERLHTIWTDQIPARVPGSIHTALVENGINGTYWSAGPRWGDYPLSVQPTNNYTQDRPQLSTLLKYKSTQQ